MAVSSHGRLTYLYYRRHWGAWPIEKSLISPAFGDSLQDAMIMRIIYYGQTYISCSRVLVGHDSRLVVVPCCLRLAVRSRHLSNLCWDLNLMHAMIVRLRNARGHRRSRMLLALFNGEVRRLPACARDPMRLVGARRGFTPGDATLARMLAVASGQELALALICQRDLPEFSTSTIATGDHYPRFTIFRRLTCVLINIHC